MLTARPHNLNLDSQHIKSYQYCYDILYHALYDTQHYTAVLCAGLQLLTELSLTLSMIPAELHLCRCVQV